MIITGIPHLFVDLSLNQMFLWNINYHLELQCDWSLHHSLILHQYQRESRFQTLEAGPMHVPSQSNRNPCISHIDNPCFLGLITTCPIARFWEWIINIQELTTPQQLEQNCSSWEWIFIFNYLLFSNLFFLLFQQLPSTASAEKHLLPLSYCRNKSKQRQSQQWLHIAEFNST